MTILHLLLLLCSTVHVMCDAFTCYKWENDMYNQGDCADPNAKQCFKPKWELYTGYSHAPEGFGCGDCSGAAKCESCAGANCNNPTTSDQFRCYNWAWDGKWTMGKEPTICEKRVEDTITCNGPNLDTATQSSSFTLMLKGCGRCSPPELESGMCEECDSDLCNGSGYFAASVILTAISTLVYLM